MSSPSPAARLVQHLFTRNRLRAAGAHLVSATEGLGYPALLNLIEFYGVEALNEFLGQRRPGSCR